MSSKETLLKKHAELQAKADELLEQLQALKEEASEEEMFPRVGKGNSYWAIKWDYEQSYRTNDIRRESDEMCYNNHNYFLKKKEAEEERLFTIARRKLQKIAAFLNKKSSGSNTSSVSWNFHAERKYFLIYNHENNQYKVDYTNTLQTAAVYFNTHENANKALSLLTEDEKRILFRRGEKV